MWGALRQPFPPPEVKAMVVLQADGSVMAGAGAGAGRGRVQAPILGAAAGHPLSKPSCSQLTQPGPRHSHPTPVQLPPTASGPLCDAHRDVGGQPEQGSPPPRAQRNSSKKI